MVSVPVVCLRHRWHGVGADGTGSGGVWRVGGGAEGGRGLGGEGVATGGAVRGGYGGQVLLLRGAPGVAVLWGRGYHFLL